jgi:hypothetical protein
MIFQGYPKSLPGGNTMNDNVLYHSQLFLASPQQVFHDERIGEYYAEF